MTHSQHPHPDKRHVMVAYRRYILGEKKKRQDPKDKRRARALVHYTAFIQEYLACKRDVIEQRKEGKST